jgi:hypothetical protein
VINVRRLGGKEGKGLFLSLAVLNKSNSLNVAVNKIRILFYIVLNNHKVPYSSLGNFI